MTRKSPIRHIKKLEAWLKTYPGFDFNGTFHVSEYMPLPGQGSTPLEPTKTTSAITQDIVGETTVIRNLYLTLYARQYGIDHFTNKDNAEFLTDFQHWAVEEQLLGNIPTFGDADTDREIFEITGALRWQDSEEPSDTEDYMWQLHLQYKLLY